jgi:hypothetical protein
MCLSRAFPGAAPHPRNLIGRHICGLAVQQRATRRQLRRDHMPLMPLYDIPMASTNRLAICQPGNSTIVDHKFVIVSAY